MFTLNFRVKQVLLLFLPGSGHQNIKLRHFEILFPTCKFGLWSAAEKTLFFFLGFSRDFSKMLSCWNNLLAQSYNSMRIFTPNGFQVNAKKNPLHFLKEYIFKVFYFRLFQVSAAGANAQGSGPNKKLAKRSAAESLLQIMGYSRPSLQPAKPALKNTNSNGSTASSSTSSTMSTSSITNGELKTTHSAHSPASKDKTKKVIFLFTYKF